MANKQLIAFRVDSSFLLGGGHVYRCLAIARLLDDFHVDSVFVCKSLDGHMGTVIADHGYRVIFLPLEASEGNDSDAEQTAESLLNSGDGRIPDWLIVDHMGIGQPWESRVRNRLGCRLMAIDGLADRRHDVDLLLDPQLTGSLDSRWDDLVPSDCRVFAGPWFAPLARGFETCRGMYPIREAGVHRLLICFGGADSGNLTLRACRVVRKVISNARECKVDVAVGASYRWARELLAFCDRAPGFVVHQGRDDLEHLMGQADLSVGAGGVMAWERAVMGLPTLLAVLADNQLNAARQLETAGAVVSLGAPDEGFEQRMQRALALLMDDPERVSRMSEAAFGVMSRWPMTDAWVQVVTDRNHNV